MMGVDKKNTNNVYDKLTPKQRAFVKEYIIDFNATRAAIKAGYSENRASEIGYQLLHKTTVQEAIRIETEARNRRVEINQDRIVQELEVIALSKITDYAEVKGNKVKVKDTDQMDQDNIAAISEIKEGKDGIGIKTHDKLKAIELLGKHMGMWKDEKQETNTNVNVSIDIDREFDKWQENSDKNTDQSTIR